jgi:peptidyl-prolyl cis-trans isomerase C
LQKIFASVLAVVVIALASATACRKPTAQAQGATTGAAGQPQAAATPQAPEPPKPMPAQLPDVLARVNGEPVNKSDFDRLVKSMELGNGPIPAERRDEILRGALDQLVTYTVMKQEAASRKVAVTEAEVDGRLKEMQGQFPNEAEFQKALAARSMTVDQFRADTKVDMMIGKMLDAEVAGDAAATEAEAKDFYAKNPDKFMQGESVRASHILIMANEKTDEAARKQARAKIDGILKRVKAGEDFAALAKENSQDGSAQQGGDLNFFRRGQMVPEFDKAAFALKPGEVSDVVTTQFGYHIIKVTERKEAAAVPYEQVSPRIVQYLKQQRANTFIETVKKKARIEVLV